MITSADSDSEEQPLVLRQHAGLVPLMKTMMLLH